MKINMNLWQQVASKWLKQMSIEKQKQIEQSAGIKVASVLQEVKEKGTAHTTQNARDEVLFLISQNDDDDDFI